MPQAETPGNHGTAARLEVFEYPADPDGLAASIANMWADTAYDGGRGFERGGPGGDSAADAAANAEFEKLLAEESDRAFASGRERGRQEGRQAEHEAQAAAQTQAAEQRTRQLREIVQAFVAERDRYLSAVEQEVVQLALAVAARVLRREAQMDPLLLTGAVRVALGQLAASTQVRLSVPAEEFALWSEAVAMLPNLALKPQVTAAAEMRAGECRVETGLGSVDLGIRSQLGEIERGFFDLAYKPSSRPGADPVFTAEADG